MRMNSKRLVSHFNSVLKVSYEQESFIQHFFLEYLCKGTEMFESEEIVFGEKEIVQHHIADVLSTFIWS